MGKLILASGSPRRKELLSQIGLEFEVITADTEEISAKTRPEELVMDLALQKAKAVQEILLDEDSRNAVILGADTIVYFDGKVLGKPGDEQDAYAMIKNLSGNTHQVYTGVALLHGKDTQTFFECTHVNVCPMSDEEILSYVATGDPLDKAGAYGIQGPFAAYVSSIEGDYNNVVGLPVCRVYQEWKKLANPQKV